MGPGRPARGTLVSTVPTKFEHTDNIKGQALANFTAEWTETVIENPEEETSLPGKEDPDNWTVHFDGSYSKGQGGAGVVLTSPTGERLKYVVQMHYQGNMISMPPSGTFSTYTLHTT